MVTFGRGQNPRPVVLDPGEDTEHLRVELPGIRLTRHGNRRAKADLLDDDALELADLLVVAAEDLEKTCLRASRSLHPAAGQGRDAKIQISQIARSLLSMS